MRVEKPNELAMALLGDQGWTMRRLDAAYASRKTQRVELAEPVPIFLDYRTAFVDEAGRLQLRAGPLRPRPQRGRHLQGQRPPPEPEVVADEVAGPILNRPASLLVPTVSTNRPAT